MQCLVNESDCFINVAKRMVMMPAFIMVWLLSGCVSSAGIELTAHELSANELSTGTAIKHAQSIAWPEMTWWQSFHDPQLNQLIEMSIQMNPTLAMAQKRVQLSQALSDRFKSNTLPTMTIDGRASRERFTNLQFIPPPWGGQTDWDNKIALGLSYDLDLWGRNESLWKSALESHVAAELETRHVKLLLIAAITHAYVQLENLYERKRIAEQRLFVIQQQLAIARKSYAAQLSAAISVDEIAIQIPVVTASIVQIDANITRLRYQLAVLSGKGPGTGDQLHRPTLSLAFVTGIPNNVPADLIGQRPDVLALKWRIEAERHQVEAAKASFYPNINLISFMGFQALGFEQLLSHSAIIVGAGPAISLPIFDGGLRRSQLLAQTSTTDIAIETYNATIIRALQEIANDLVSATSAKAQFDEQRLALTQAEHVHDLERVKFQAGLSNYQQVLQSELAVLNYQDSCIDSMTAQYESYIELMKALGGGVLITHHDIPDTRHDLTSGHRP